MSEDLGDIRQEIGELKGLVVGLTREFEKNSKVQWDLHNHKIAPAIALIPGIQDEIKDLKLRHDGHEKRHDRALSRWVGISGGLIGIGTAVWSWIRDGFKP